ncbi:MAG: marine proteobacterial sortase target protein [Gammaproteobacteria bacterium]|jgi:Ca-activated chloride channel family protein
MNNAQSANATVTGKPSIVKDACVGLLTAIGIGLVASMVFVAVVMALSSTAVANPRQENLHPAEVGLSDVQQGSLLFRTDRRGVFHIAPTVDTDVRMTVSGMVARTKVIQTFTNPDDFWVEGIYVFPLPDNSAVDHMRMIIGERIVEGVIKERAEAKKTYEKAKREGKKAALMDQERPNVFTNSVANIGPRESITIEIEYQQTLHYEKQEGTGQFQLRFPLTMTPRYIPGNPVERQQAPPAQQPTRPALHKAQYTVSPATTYHEQISAFSSTGWAVNTDAVPDASRITPPFNSHNSDTEDSITNPVNIEVVLNTGFPINQINSPYHTVHTTRPGVGQAVVQLAQGPVPADRDFKLVWTIDPGFSPNAALFKETIDGDVYNLIMLMPPNHGAGGSRHLPREVIYIIDTSGSMGGTSITQAKAALSMALKRLKPADSFNIIQFNSVTDALFESGAQPANPHNLYRANRYVNALYSTGGTEMLPAISLALDDKVYQEAKIRQVVFLTDGSVGNETQLFEVINQKLGHSRLFTVGIGSAPNSFFMKRAAQFGRGTYTFIGSTDEVQARMEELFAKLETPVLSDIQVSYPDNVAVEIWPNRVPDLYLGEPVILAVKATDFDGDIRIRGKRGGSTWETQLPLRGGQSGAGIGSLWARAKIKTLMDSLRTGAKKDDVRSAVINVALKHHLVSKYTSMVAVEKTPSRPRWDPLDKRGVPNNLPHGSTMGQVVGSFARTATDAQLKILIGLLLLTFSLLAVRRLNRQEAWL